MTGKGWLIFGTLVLLAMGSAFYFTGDEKVSLDGVDASAVQLAAQENGNIGDHTIGKAGKVVLIQYSDFQCPGCASAHPVIKALIEKYKDKMLFVSRSKLLPYHQNARAAASFAEAASLQGKYWEMHNVLFENQTSWASLSGQERTDYFANLIASVGGDPEKAKTDISLDEIVKKINYDEALAKKHGVEGTPSFLLNGKMVNDYVKDGKIVPEGTEGARYVWSSLEDFDKLIIQPALKEAGVQ